METPTPTGETKPVRHHLRNLEKPYPSERSVNSAIARADDGHSSAVIKRLRVCVDPSTGAICPIGAQKIIDSEGNQTEQSICPYFTGDATSCAVGEDAFVAILKEMRNSLNPLEKVKDLFWERRYDAKLVRELEVATKGMPGLATLKFREQELSALTKLEEMQSKREISTDSANQLTLLRRMKDAQGNTIIDKATRTVIPAKKEEEKKEEILVEEVKVEEKNEDA
jgi:hypothetical protein